MEAIVSNVRAHDKGCVGCKKFGLPVLLTISTGESGATQFHDFFMTTEQAEKAISQLQKVLVYNRPITPEVDIRIPYMNS